MRKIIFIVLILFITSTIPAYAHPGRTASDGCHYCRTNCDKWGETWNERHCHGGGSAPKRETPLYPTSIPKPTLKPTVKPTLRPKPTAKPKPTKKPTPTKKPKPTKTPKKS